MSTETNQPTATALRVWGVLTAAAGALLAGWGATQPWVTTGFGPEDGTLTSIVVGTDLTGGLLVLAFAVLAPIAILLTRFVGSESVRRALAVFALSAGLVIAALSVAGALTAKDSLGPVDVDELVADAVDQLGLDEETARQQVEKIMRDLGGFTSVKTAVWLTAAGGLMIALGGGLTLVDLRRSEPGAPAADPSLQEPD
jgi:apolipoprotein N-acyltransferase